MDKRCPKEQSESVTPKRERQQSTKQITHKTSDGVTKHSFPKCLIVQKISTYKMYFKTLSPLVAILVFRLE
jgi:hypothetical protein